ncbi:MAG: GH92 family glycosyl hydrolase [Pyrinomonadaceae bacterium]|nr:GH92 family glycosyl hydrolase [Acidobacteriota bacterium]MBP7474323.1 GH92 family glycosyl hydrolase [Pyrinomonadaceae bacterium]MBP9109095.1 GH92 family glycosyl hydrolase [Pyrinomonadaceae bacterium]
MRTIIALSILLSLQATPFAQTTTNYVKHVNPLIGTQKMGHTFPGATVPFGSVQLSPDTDQQPHNVGGKYNKDTYKYCAGYQYDDTEIVGFSHTHFSGTGHSDLGDFLVMPTVGPLQLEPGTKGDPKSGFRSAYSHANETAEAGYYKVKLDDDNIFAEMTATTRVGMHQYTFPASDNSHIILDLMHGIYNYEDKNVWTFVRVENDHTIVGYRQTNGWARTRTVYFAMEFSKPFASYGFKDFGKQDYRGFWRKFDQSKNFPEAAGKQIRANFDFKTTANEKIKIKFALSPVSTNGAVSNLRSEIPHWDFERVKREAQGAWNKELSKIAVTTIDQGEMTNFYTAMYHALLTPTVYMDTDGQYKGLDQNVHKAAAGTTNYTTFSLWDTYRALHPLLNLIQPSRNRDMVRSMQAHYDQSVHKMLPVWSHYANENWCMIGYHSVSVIADAIVTGNLTGPEAIKALEASAQTARTKYYDGLEFYMQLGYVPEDKNGSSVSKTLEYAYDDWAIAQAAKKLRKTAIYNEFIKRSENWRNVYDAKSGFMRPRMSDGRFREKFDVLSTHDQGFIEGNAWNYSLYVPHDPAGMIELRGGQKKFTEHLDELFTMHLPDEFFAETEDITREGIIGNYVHGNEPAHHAAYLYNWTDSPWKTQERVRMILKNQYIPTPDGLGGNDDCGQMSAWYLFTALGFYPVAPGSGQYSLGSPVVKTATVNLENGRKLTIEARNQSDTNVYVKSITLNGKPINERFIIYDQITAGGKLVFEMSDKHP